MKAKHILMSMLIVMLFGGVSSCTQKQENKILDIVSPRKIIGHRTVYKYNFLILLSAKIQMSINNRPRCR